MNLRRKVWLPLKTNLEEFLAALPRHLAERTWARSSSTQAPRGAYVMYWTHHALRCDENPALDVAVRLANQWRMPLLVYQGLSERYRFASDRHHTFILETARELQATYAALGIDYLLHVDRRGHRQPRLAQLAMRSAAIVTEDFPLEATRQWTDQLADSGRVTMLLVDTACVVPPRLVGKAFDRAFAYRSATEKLYRERVGRAWPESELPVRRQAQLPFASLSLTDCRISDVVATCEIDHSVGPVTDTRGGSNAGYNRWQTFCRHGLSRYAKRRNQIEVDGVSRMSAYLHYGMVSAFRLAREAQAARAEKYLDELLIWRELAYAFCYFSRELETSKSLPEWANATLTEHQADLRTTLSWERLARAKSGARLWDAAQRSLLKHGELHNNVRMTWGKALVQWSKDHSQALERLIDLNHRYALDGRDPASYGGILWCLGQFDRPFLPEQPIYGTVRTRPIEYHAHRTDMVAYEKVVDRKMEPSPRIAIIGAGLGGSICGRVLSDHGQQVQLFEKSHRASGRASSRVLDAACAVDHGAQYFTIRDATLERYLASWTEEGLVASWDGKLVSIDSPGDFKAVAEQKRFVGVPTMENLGQHLSRDLQVTCDCEVAQVERLGSQYLLRDRQGGERGMFDVVLWNCPPQQVARLAPEECSWRSRLDCVEMVPCWAVMLKLEQRWSLPWDGAFVNQGQLSWLARDSSKPGRAPIESWVLHSTGEWAAENLEASKEDVVAGLIEEAQRIAGRELPGCLFARAHRWLYARPKASLPEACLWDEDRSLGACGDWCGGPRVEGALKSGIAMAGRVLGSLHERCAVPTNDLKLRQLNLFD